MKRLAISIVSWNTSEMLRSCLASLREQCDPDDVRVIVVDNASSDGTPEMVRDEFPEVQLIESGGNLGFGKGHNLAVAASAEPFVLFLNPDAAFTEPAHLALLGRFASDPKLGIAGCKMTFEDGAPQPLGYQAPPSPWREFLVGLVVSRKTEWLRRCLLPYHDAAVSGEVRKIYGGCMMVRREAADLTGWFDERFFMYGEDVDLCHRMEDGGWKMFYDASVSVMHVCGGASKKAPGRFSTLMQCESISKYMLKWHGRTGRMLYVGGIQVRARVRLCGLWIAKLVGGRKGASRTVSSVEKYRAMLKWSLGQLKPSIPE